jgi:putative transposase
MEFYHIYNRGVDKRIVFLDDMDRVRFVHDMFIFNDIVSVDPNYGKRFLSHRYLEGRKRDPLVDIHAFCLMDNHYHMLVSERVENGMSKFMKKLNQGYAQYFNERYDRSGVLWQGVYKKVLIQRDGHFLYIPHYIHLNALDSTMPEWRQGRVRDRRKALKHLAEYHWSSYLDYIGEKNFASVIMQRELADFFDSPAAYKADITNIITSANPPVPTDSIEFK